MSAYRNILRAAAGLCLSAVVLLSPASHAQESDGWQWRGSAYLWLSSIESVTRFPGGATGPTIDVDAGEILERRSCQIDRGAVAGPRVFRGPILHVQPAHARALSRGKVKDFIVDANRPAVNRSRDHKACAAQRKGAVDRESERAPRCRDTRIGGG